MHSIPSVTVIVPVYGVELYIEKCARSIFEQTLKEIEILFVNDCSKDRSVEIIERILDLYPERKASTRIINMPSNSGQAAVRRQGIIEATGDYIIHCDGDDWVDVDLYEKMYLEAIRTNADIVVSDEVLEYENRSQKKRIADLPSDGKQLMREWYKNTIGLFCHNKLVRRTLYVDNDILPWIGLNMWEDNGLFARLFYYATKVSQIHGPVYHYNRSNVNAMTAGYGIQQVEQMIGVASHLTDFYESKEDAKDYQKTIWAFQFLAKLNLITNSFDQYKRYKEIFPESANVIKEIPLHAFSAKGKFRFQMVRYGLAPLFILMFKVRNLVLRCRLA